MRESLRAILTLALLLPGPLACRSDKPAARVQKAFDACRAAVEAGDALAATEPLDPDFRGPDGLDKGTARLFLLGLFRQERVGVTVLRNDLAPRGREVLQEVDLLLTGRGRGLLPQEASRRRFQLRWRPVGNHYRLLELRDLASPTLQERP